MYLQPQRFRVVLFSTSCRICCTSYFLPLQKKTTTLNSALKNLFRVMTQARAAVLIPLCRDVDHGHFHKFSWWMFNMVSGA